MEGGPRGQGKNLASKRMEAAPLTLVGTPLWARPEGVRGEVSPVRPGIRGVDAGIDTCVDAAPQIVAAHKHKPWAAKCWRRGCHAAADAARMVPHDLRRPPAPQCPVSSG